MCSGGRNGEKTKKARFVVYITNAGRRGRIRLAVTSRLVLNAIIKRLHCRFLEIVLCKQTIRKTYSQLVIVTRSIVKTSTCGRSLTRSSLNCVDVNISTDHIVLSRDRVLTIRLALPWFSTSCRVRSTRIIWVEVLFKHITYKLFHVVFIVFILLKKKNK